MGWAVASKHDQAIGKLGVTLFFFNQWRVSDQRTGDTVDVALKVGGVWSTPYLFKWGSRLFRTGAAVVVANPITQVVTYAYVAGAITSDAIDPDEGLDNYLGFTTGGYFGNEPNYLTGDANDSGYFNVIANIGAIIEAESADPGIAEAVYIAAYWNRKAALKEHRERSGFSYYF